MTPKENVTIIKPKITSMNAVSCLESKIKNPIVISNKERDNITVPICNRVFFPILCKIQIAIVAPTTT